MGHYKMEEEDKPTLKNKSKLYVIIASCIVGAVLIIGSIAYASSKKADPAVQISSSELSGFDGKEGRKCYVVVEKIVYVIKQGNKWKDGEHIPSEGQAYCGRDLSEVISKSPHGKSILSILTKVGTIK